MQTNVYKQTPPKWLAVHSHQCPNETRSPRRPPRRADWSPQRKALSLSSKPNDGKKVDAQTTSQSEDELRKQLGLLKAKIDSLERANLGLIGQVNQTGKQLAEQKALQESKFKELAKKALDDVAGELKGLRDHNELLLRARGELTEKLVAAASKVQSLEEKIKEMSASFHATPAHDQLVSLRKAHQDMQTRQKSLIIELEDAKSKLVLSSAPPGTRGRNTTPFASPREATPS